MEAKLRQTKFKGFNNESFEIKEIKHNRFIIGIKNQPISFFGILKQQIEAVVTNYNEILKNVNNEE